MKDRAEGRLQQQQSDLATRIQSSLSERDERQQMIHCIALGDSYAEDAISKNFAEWTYLIFAAALWNHALDIAYRLDIKSYKTMLRLRLSHIESVYIGQFISTCDEYWRERLVKIRTTTKQKLDKIAVNNIRFIYEKTNRDMRLFLQDLLWLPMGPV